MKKSMIILYILAPLFFTMPSDAEAQLAVIVNKSNSTNDLTFTDLKNIYLGKVSTFSHNTRVVLAEYAPLKKKFYKIVLGEKLGNVKKYWIAYVLSGKSGDPPIEFKNIDEVKKFVSQNPGAICFIDIADLDKSIKVLTIDGQKPVSVKYRLK